MDRGREETRQDEEEAAPLIKNKGVGSHSLLMDAIQYQGWNLAEQRTSAVCKVFDVVEERKRRRGGGEGSVGKGEVIRGKVAGGRC